MVWDGCGMVWYGGVIYGGVIWCYGSSVACEWWCDMEMVWCRGCAMVVVQYGGGVGTDTTAAVIPHHQYHPTIIPHTSFHTTIPPAATIPHHSTTIPHQHDTTRYHTATVTTTILQHPHADTIIIPPHHTIPHHHHTTPPPSHQPSYHSAEGEVS